MTVLWVGQSKKWLEKFLELPYGIPDSDTFRWVFDRLEPEWLSECLYEWLSCNRKADCVIAVDGKTICGSGDHGHTAYHVVSTFVVENQMVLGKIAVPEKSNEITVVPKLLQSLEISGSIVTADVIGRQEEIVKMVRAGKVDYVILRKENSLLCWKVFLCFLNILPKSCPELALCKNMT